MRVLDITTGESVANERWGTWPDLNEVGSVSGKSGQSYLRRDDEKYKKPCFPHSQRDLECATNVD